MFQMLKMSQGYKMFQVLQMFQDVTEVCKVLTDSFAGVLLHQYLFVPLNFYMVFCDIPRILINSSGRILYHQYILIFINFINFINFTSVSSGNVQLVMLNKSKPVYLHMCSSFDTIPNNFCFIILNMIMYSSSLITVSVARINRTMFETLNNQGKNNQPRLAGLRL